MKNRFIWLFALLLLSSSLTWATQMMVVGEVFSAPWCGSCPTARSALSQLYNSGNAEYLIPLVWNIDPPEETPGGNTRYYWYPGNGYIPWNVMGGDILDVGSNLAALQTAYNQKVNIDSPFAIDLSMSLAGDQLTLTADVEVTGNVTTTNNKVFLVVARLYENEDADYVYLVCGRSTEQSVTITQVGETMSVSEIFTLNSSWALEDLKMVAMIQNWTAPKTIVQAAMSDFQSLTAMFSADIVSGPPTLSVHFQDLSTPLNGVVSWAWDFDGDNQIDSTEQNPSWTYDTPGAYDVTLTVSDGTDTNTSTYEDYIVVQPVGDVAGTLAGHWSPMNGVYQITGDVLVPAEHTLMIDPGTEIVCAQGTKIMVEGSLIIEEMGRQPVDIGSVDGEIWQGIHIRNADALSIINNATIHGAALHAIQVENSPLELRNSVIRDNTSPNMGSALHILNSDNVLVEQSVICNNVSGGAAGPITIIGSNPTFRNTIIVNNDGIVAGSFAVKTDANPLIENCVIANNQGQNAELFLFQTQASILNSVIRTASPATLGLFNSTPVVNYTNLTSGYEGTGNIDTDPLFILPSAGNGSSYDGLASSWQLLPGSPCVDAGNPEAQYNDIEDQTSPGNALYPALGTIRNDMGAYGGMGHPIVGIEDPQPEVPSIGSLRVKAWPNPFNPEVNIALAIPSELKNRPVSVSIYNVKGQRVKTLLDRVLDSSDTTMIWNGTDEAGNSVASGVYFVKATAGTFSTSSRIMLLK